MCSFLHFLTTLVGLPVCVLFPLFFLFFYTVIDLSPLRDFFFPFLFYERVPVVLLKWCCLDNILCRLIPARYRSTSGEPDQSTD